MKFQIKSNSKEANKLTALNSIIECILKSNLTEEEKQERIEAITAHANK